MKTNIYLLFLSLSLIISSCKDPEEKEVEEATDVQETEMSAPELKVYALDGGTVQVNKLEIFAQDDRYQGMSKTFADAIYIIEHPNGRMLWDAGLAESLVGQEPYTTPDGAFTVSRKDSIVNQLKVMNLTPEDFDYLALSHTHFDHSGSASQFKNATWLVQTAEYDFATSEDTKKADPGIYEAIKDLTNIQKLNGDHDVFGDGSVMIKLMPGHTPGHQVLYLNLAETGPIMLSGDMYHFEENRTDKVVPSFNTSVENTLSSMEKFEAFAKEHNARVFIQHSPDDFKAFPNFPEALK